MFYAQQALEVGLIDEIGDLNRAVELSKELSRDMNFINQYMNS